MTNLSDYNYFNQVPMQVKDLNPKIHPRAIQMALRKDSLLMKLVQF